MKGQQIVRSLLGIMFVCSLLVLSTTAQEPASILGPKPPVPDSRTNSSVRASSGITSIGASTVNYVSPSTIAYAVGFEYELCFNVTVSSSDAEYMDRFDVDLPDFWSVLDVTRVERSPTATCSSVDTIAEVDAGNVVYWQIDGEIPSGCGPWNNGTYDFCATIHVPGCTDAPWSLPWNIIGDGWGVEPHQISGNTDPLGCEAGLYLSPDSPYGITCQGVTNNITLNLANFTGAEDTFSLEYYVTTGNGTISGPDEIYLGPGADQDLEVNLTSQPCLHAGQQVEALVFAEGNGFADLSYITFYIVEEDYCVKCQSTYLPCILRQD